MSAEGVVLDLGWLEVLRNAEDPQGPNRRMTGLAHNSQAMRDAVFSGTMRELKQSGLEDILLIAEQLVVNEYFIIDGLAFDARLDAIPQVIAPLVQRRDPPESVYLDAARAVVALAKKFGDSAEQSPILDQLRTEMSPEGPSPFWSGPDKRLHDYMFQSGSALRQVASAASTGNDTLSRVLFYLEFGRHLGDSPLLGPNKRRWLGLIGEKMKLNMHQVISRKFDTKVLATIQAELADSFTPVTLETPPVAELVLRKSIYEGSSILEAAIQLRESPEATNYRALLQELRSQLRRGRPGELDAQRALAGLDNIATSWARHHSSLIGVTIQKRILKWDKLPILGSLLEAAGMSQTEIVDRILNAPPGYLAFISSWYRPAA